MKFTPALLSCCCFLLLSSCALFKPVETTRTGSQTRGDDRPSPTSFIRTDIVSHAQDLMGIRYKYGGNRPDQGFDCSGFVRYLYQNAGMNIERVARDQATQGKRINSEQARPGDLVFYKRKDGKPVFHVSVVVQATPTELWVIHATSSRGVIRENVLSSSYWRPLIYQVRDVLN